jgi:hypothetical protein
MLAKDQPMFEGPLRACAERLQPYNFGEDWKAGVDAMNDAEVREATGLINATAIEAEEIIRGIRDLRRFAERININSLKRWGEHPGCPLKVHFASHLGRISFGKDERANMSVDVPRNMLADITPFELRQVGPETRRRRIKTQKAGSTVSLEASP